MNTRWVLTGNWNGSAWQEVIDSNLLPHPQNEIQDITTSTSSTVGLLDGSKARITREVKYSHADLLYSISAIGTKEERDYIYPATPVTYNIRQIIENLIENDVSVRIQYQEYSGSWTTKATYAGYFKSMSQEYKMYGMPQLYISDVTLERFDVDGTGEY